MLTDAPAPPRTRSELPESALAGALDVTFAPGPRGVVACTSRTAALEVRGPFENGPLPRYALRNVTAGVFGGDAYDIAVRVREGARVAVAPTAASKTYAGRGGTARVDVTIEVESGARLDYDAGATILQRDCHLEQSTQLVVHPGAALAYREIVALGRLSRGERLEFARYAAALALRTPEGTTLYEERCDLRPDRNSDAIDTAVGGAGVFGTLILVGAEVAACVLADARSEVYAGITALPNNAGLLVRALAPRIEVVAELFETVAAPWLANISETAA